ncbi:MAG: hypothetical protein LUB63_08170 [Oscillospiraceae bacterium]|nr:hypothetical protein [Oscillospiraceae bacterium]
MALVTSYILLYENSQNPYEIRKKAISEFIRNHSTEYVDYNRAGEIDAKVSVIMKSGVKAKDAHHVACVIFASCDYFLTTDKRLLQFKTNEIQLLNPVDFIERLEDHEYD